LKVALVICVDFFTFYNDYIIPPAGSQPQTRNRRHGSWAYHRALNILRGHGGVVVRCAGAAEHENRPDGGLIAVASLPV
jgi:hypothetical protein